MTVTCIEADLTTLNVDAIVNAANSALRGGRGVDGAIHAAAGPELLAHCRRLRETCLTDGLAPGLAFPTPGFDLPARFVIHTVAPNRHTGHTEPNTLRRCFVSCLEVAHALGLRTIAFPALGAGSYGWDHEAVAAAASKPLRTTPLHVTVALSSRDALTTWQRVLDAA